ncbi:MAG: hypothetical protein ABR593_06925 [Candidatus Limnocylindria bacterium]
MILLAVLLVGLAACGTLGPLDPRRDEIGPQGGEGGAEEGDAGQPPDAPPPVTVRAGDETFALEAWTYCFANGCADGSPPVNPPDLGAAPRIEVEFALRGWDFEAQFVPVGEVCPRRQTVELEQTGDHTYVLEPAGHADTYDVTLFGRGDGDLFVTFRWTTQNDGPMPIPRGRLAVLADHDGAVDSYGVELELADLAATPESAAAEVTVTAANGESVTFELVPAQGCIAEGTLYWDGPDQAGLDAAGLGPPPFTYDVVVTLDGVGYSARAAWPDDEIEGNEPSVLLDFTPALPSLP